MLTGFRSLQAAAACWRYMYGVAALLPTPPSACGLAAYHACMHTFHAQPQTAQNQLCVAQTTDTAHDSPYRQTPSKSRTGDTSTHKPCCPTPESTHTPCPTHPVALSATASVAHQRHITHTVSTHSCDGPCNRPHTLQSFYCKVWVLKGLCDAVKHQPKQGKGYTTP